jgi:hypothetical protein
MIFRRDQPFAQVVVPAHKQVDTGTLSAILVAAGLTAQQFLDLL